MNDFKGKYLKLLPSVNKIIERPELAELVISCPHTLIVKAVREAVDSRKSKILSAESEDQLKNLDLSIEGVVKNSQNLIRQNGRMSLRRVINATGDVLSNDLGRSPLNEFAQKAIQDVAGRYSTLSVDRDSHLQGLFSPLTGAESGLVVNNNTAAILLILNTICKGKEVIISRGELIENDDSRLPDVVDHSGAKLVSVGTTNKTHLYDYRRAINENTGAIMKASMGNFRIVGFTEQVPLAELAKLASEFNLPLIDNIGNGCLVDLTQMGFPEEPYVPLSVRAGADIVCLSGDRLLGGPQAGIVVGKAEYISMMRNNPLYRALRPDKFTIATLEATLRSYLDADVMLKHNVVLQFLCKPLNEIASMAEILVEKLKGRLDDHAVIKVVEGYSQINSIAIPPEKFPTRFVTIEPSKVSAKGLAKRLLMRDIPIYVNFNIYYISIDPRSVWADEIDEIADALVECCLAS